MIRWLGGSQPPDPVMQAPTWSQGLNRYSYAFNDPVNNTDPSGFVADGLGYFASNPSFAGTASGSLVGTVGTGAGYGLLNVGTSWATGEYDLFNGSGPSSHTVSAPSAAPKSSGVNPHASGAGRENKGGIQELARPIPAADLAVPESVRGPDQRLAQNFQPHGYCHEDGPCHDSFYIPEISTGDLEAAAAAISNAVSKGVQAIKIILGRRAYVNAVKGIAEKAAGMRAAGWDAERIVRTVHAERRALGIQFKNLTPPARLAQIYARNVAKYGDELGPTIQWLREQGKSWEQIIESASRPGGSDLGF